MWKNIAKKSDDFGHPEVFCSDVEKSNWESCTVTCHDDSVPKYIEKITKRSPYGGKTVTGGIVTCVDSSWLMSWTINRQGQYPDQPENDVAVWVYGLFTDIEGDYIKKKMRDCTGKEITKEWLYHLGVPVNEIDDLAETCTAVPVMMPYITSQFMPRKFGDRPYVVPKGGVNFAFLGQFAETLDAPGRDTVFTTEYSGRTAMEAVYVLCGVEKAVPEVFASRYDIRYLDYDLIQRAASAGWITGYPDGTFKPDKNITRAEVVAITNRMLDRKADQDFVDQNLGKLLQFTDLDKSYWAYYPILEATNGHDYIRHENKLDEHWKEVTGKTFVYDK